jgi:hypothetical protein
MRAIEGLWIHELRPYFQSVSREFIGPDKEAILSRHPKFPSALHSAMVKQPNLKKLHHFGHGHWDLLRFIALIKALGKTDPLCKIDGVATLVKDWGNFRNPLAHEGFDNNEKIFANRDLMVHIATAAKGVPAIRMLNKNSKEANDIYEKLNRLESLLTGATPKEETNVFSLRM